MLKILKKPQKIPKNPKNIPFDLPIGRSPTPTTGTAAVEGAGAIVLETESRFADEDIVRSQDADTRIKESTGE
ncbi:unnamed protein product [Bursaphelenchus xylophilus]|uniref:(pine wood nematode) hypothetical protein n=1 Tax=Bursaphelenchus xylophilus TaxID=6326 RepID=A0A1I7SKL4_BURXY|nr:unnamed protein product [Bursaphelenchus xylophilus]CAG9089249.1 unnamed protein product [Bursaphelenchus xylophilus]